MDRAVYCTEELLVMMSLFHFSAIKMMHLN